MLHPYTARGGRTVLLRFPSPRGLGDEIGGHQSRASHSPSCNKPLAFPVPTLASSFRRCCFSRSLSVPSSPASTHPGRDRTPHRRQRMTQTFPDHTCYTNRTAPHPAQPGVVKFGLVLYPV